MIAYVLSPQYRTHRHLATTAGAEPPSPRDLRLWSLLLWSAHL
jgi:hypothetical protein